MGKQNFKEWFMELLEYGNKRGWYVDAENPEYFKSYYESGFLPQDALDDDMNDTEFED